MTQDLVLAIYTGLKHLMRQDLVLAIYTGLKGFKGITVFKLKMFEVEWRRLFRSNFDTRPAVERCMCCVEVCVIEPLRWQCVCVCVCVCMCVCVFVFVCVCESV